jgi:uncharacterized membrane protein (UPF0127 family)
MAVTHPRGYAFNLTRRAYLATELHVANTHWSRLCGLMGTNASHFPAGRALWIVPCHGVHTFAMRFPIDVLYLDNRQVVVHVEKKLAPWRVAPVRWQAKSVLELPENTLDETSTVVGDQLEITTGATSGAMQSD